MPIEILKERVPEEQVPSRMFELSSLIDTWVMKHYGDTGNAVEIADEMIKVLQDALRRLKSADMLDS